MKLYTCIVVYTQYTNLMSAANTNAYTVTHTHTYTHTHTSNTYKNTNKCKLSNTKKERKT